MDPSRHPAFACSRIADPLLSAVAQVLSGPSVSAHLPVTSEAWREVWQHVPWLRAEQNRLRKTIWFN
jgi:hypothetical protein